MTHAETMKTILITGGTGFLGKNLALALKSEYNVVLGARNNKQMLKAEHLTGCETTPLDITNIESVRDAVNFYGPDTIIHAGATKFVDRAEKNPTECVDVNVLGSMNVARVAIDKGVKNVLGISTDKAAPPIRNIYGLSKASMEKMFVSLDAKSDTNFACVRYGNVTWSTGSVLCIWNDMIKENNYLESSGWNMRRYFFAVDEAVKLVTTALDNMNTIHGKILSRTMKSAKMEDIINTWLEQTGGTWTKTEGRPGDRLDEFLIGEIEHEFTTKLTFDDIEHYLISPNVKVQNPITSEISSFTAERLTKEEILNIVNNPPKFI